MIDIIVNISQSVSSRATNPLHSTTESQKRQNTTEIGGEEYTSITP